MRDARAVRNNNPGNLDAGDSWMGLMPRGEMTPEQASEKRFAVFQSPRWGFRALCIVLINYERLYGLNTVAKIMSRFAPPGENDTNAYVDQVCRETGRRPDDLVDLRDPVLLGKIVHAIAVHECGGWLFDTVDLQAGFALAEA